MEKLNLDMNLPKGQAVRITSPDHPQCNEEGVTTGKTDAAGGILLHEIMLTRGGSEGLPRLAFARFGALRLTETTRDQLLETLEKHYVEERVMQYTMYCQAIRMMPDHLLRILVDPKPLKAV